ncbi:MAG TPA: VWA domain-containing protein [Anaerolineae bacterium]|nr:VWA domain-containing protein [Anaerolineae bacterium]
MTMAQRLPRALLVAGLCLFAVIATAEAAPERKGLLQLPPAPGFTPIPVPIPVCEGDVPHPGPSGSRRVLFISGWDFFDLDRANLVRNLAFVRNVSDWDLIRTDLVAEAQHRGEVMSKEHAHYYSYRGVNEGCDSRNPPIYSAYDTRFTADRDAGESQEEADQRLYDDRAAEISRIMNAYPADTFILIAHSLGGAVAGYWAGTAADDLVKRVEFIATLDSPLGGNPGGCFQPNDWVPPLVHEAIRRGATRVNLLTLRNSHDSVVKPESATVSNNNSDPNSDVWRDLKTYLAGTLNAVGDLPNDCNIGGHTRLKVAGQVRQTLLDAAFPGTLVEIEDQPVEGSRPLHVGPSDHPRPFWITVRWPRDSKLANVLRQGTSTLIQIHIGGRPARIKEIQDQLDIKHVPALLHDATVQLLQKYKQPLQGYHRLRILVEPPALAGPTDADLQIAIDDAVEQRAKALIFDSPTNGGGTSPTEGSRTVLVIDTSTSMADPDASGSSKIEAARRAGERVTRMIANESGAGSEELSLVRFSDGADVVQPLTTTHTTILKGLETIYASGSTNMGQGLDLAMEMMDAADKAGHRRRTLILLSDGNPNEGGVDSRANIRGNQMPKLSSSFDCVYAIGLGQSASQGGSQDSLDEDFLREIAATTGACGGYFSAATAGDLVAAFLKSRHQAAGGTMVIERMGQSIKQDETTPADAIDVAAGAGELNLTLDWPGSKLDLLLTDPRGVRVDSGYPGARLFLDRPPAQAIITSPAAGRWTVAVHGSDVPEGSIDYSLLGSVRSARAPVPAGSGAGVLLVIAGGLALAWLLGSSPATLRYQLQPTGDQAHMPMVGLGPFPYQIGRSRGSQLCLAQDQRVSDRHAVIEQSASRGLSIRDLNSTNGTFVNDARVIGATPLAAGDRVRVGRSTFTVFESR